MDNHALINIVGCALMAAGYEFLGRGEQESLASNFYIAIFLWVGAGGVGLFYGCSWFIPGNGLDFLSCFIYAPALFFSFCALFQGIKKLWVL